MLSVAEIINLLNSIPVGYKSPEDNCFNAGNQTYIPEYKKLGVITVANELQEDLPETDKNDLFCDMPGCQVAFKNAASYQSHFYNEHRYICSVCRRCLPTAHLLDLHILECHDSYFIIRAKRGEAMYSCFLGECLNNYAANRIKDIRKNHPKVSKKSMSWTLLTIFLA
nr:protein lethal(2)k10201 [Bactrocera oleae]